MNPHGKTALITGGARRVGKAITLGLAAAGANVVINYLHSATEAEKTEAEARALGVTTLALGADISDPQQVQAMVAAVHARFGAIDILVNSAAGFQPTPFPTDDIRSWLSVWENLIHGPFYVTNAVAPLMLRQGHGSIVNIVDRLAFEPRPGMGAHGVGKAALVAMTRQFALELAPTVRVNAVAPGPVLPPPGADAERIAAIPRGTLLQRWGTPEDVADAVLYLVRAEYVTGDIITVDGGEQIGRSRSQA